MAAIPHWPHYLLSTQWLSHTGPTISCPHSGYPTLAALFKVVSVWSREEGCRCTVPIFQDNCLLRVHSSPVARARRADQVCQFCVVLFYSILGCVLPLQEVALHQSSIFLCPLLSSSIPLLVAPQCHLSSDVLVFRLILHPLSATLSACVVLITLIDSHDFRGRPTFLFPRRSVWPLACGLSRC